MSEIKVDKISPQSGTALAIGDSGDTITIPSGATITNSGTATGFGVDTSLSNLASAGEQRVAHCWIQFTGTGTVAITDSYNVASITDHATGRYSVTYTSAMPNDDYCVTGSSMHISSGNGFRTFTLGSSDNGITGTATGSFMCGTFVSFASLSDSTSVTAVVHGD